MGANPEIDGAHLREAIAKRLPEPMRPSSFVMLETLPLTVNGKIDRRALPVPALGSSDTRQLLLPATATEHAVLAVWHELLGPTPLSTDDDFFRVGGDSLLTGGQGDRDGRAARGRRE